VRPDALTITVALCATFAMTLLAVRAFRAAGSLSGVLAPLGALLRPGPPRALARLKARLARAGLRNPEQLDAYLAAHALCRLGGLAAALWCGLRPGGGLLGGLSACLAIAVGFLAAPRVLDMRAVARQRAITRALPNALDLLVTCVDAGLSLEQSLARLAAQLGASEPVLADELRVVVSEMEAGVSVDEAMRRLGGRTQVEEMQTLCAVIGQAVKLGARVAQILREYASSARRRRMAQLDERAGRVASRLTLPLAFFLLPASLLVMLGPALVMIMKNMGGR